MRISLQPTICNPFFSNRVRISPHSPRWTASGLRMMSVRSMFLRSRWVGRYIRAFSAGKLPRFTLSCADTMVPLDATHILTPALVLHDRFIPMELAQDEYFNRFGGPLELRFENW